MNTTLTNAVLKAIGWIIAAILFVTLAPIVVTGLYGKAVPDSLIAMADKTVTGLASTLGTAIGALAMMIRSRNPEGTPADPVAVKDVNP